MGIGGSLRELAAFIDACEADGRVSAVEIGAIEPSSPGTLTADVTVELPARPAAGAVELAATAIDGDGRLRLAFETTDPVVPASEHDVTVEPSTAAVTDDGTVTVTLTASVSTDTDDARDGNSTLGTDARNGGGRTDETGSAGGIDSPDGASELALTPTDRSATSDRSRSASAGGGPEGGSQAESGGTARRRSASDVPPFEDRELLQRVYEEQDTFAEMPAALGMDVTAETVRRYMIDYGIHEPRSYDTDDSGEDEAESQADDATDAADATEQSDETGETGETDETDETDAEAPVVLADGIGLPEEVTVDTIVETVRESNTIYEVTRDIGVDREAALELLRELDLLEFVVGRLATEAERSISRDTVVERLRQHADTQ